MLYVILLILFRLNFLLFLLSKYLKYLKGREFNLRCSLISVKEDKTSIYNDSLMLIEI